jgi:hypothetical protein
MRQSSPDFGHGFQVNVLKNLQGVPCWLDSGCPEEFHMKRLSIYELSGSEVYYTA